METAWYFLTRATATLIPLILAAFGAGLWMGWIKWHSRKREYGEVEKDYHKLHDIHDVARATIPELEARRKALTDEIDGLEGLLGRYQDANRKYEAESQRLNEALRAQKRNFDALEDIWRGKLARAEARAAELEAALGRVPTAPTTPIPEVSHAPASIDDAGRLIPFPELALEDEPGRQETAPALPRAGGKQKNRRAV